MNLEPRQPNVLRANSHVETTEINESIQSARDLNGPRLSHLFGRDELLVKLHHMLGDFSTRLLSLVGPGGVGKTRLARSIAHARGATDNGALVVELASIGDSERILPQVARELGLTDIGRTPLLTAIANAVDGQRLLLVLDNLEHLAEANSVVQSLLDAVDTLQILVTSRIRLGLRAETVEVIHPLPVPSPDHVLDLNATEQSPAIALFLTRARVHDPSITLTAENAGAIVELCRRVDGLPLALEILASRAHVLSLSDMVDRLGLPLLKSRFRDGNGRHQSVEASIQWSFDLLSPSARDALCKLAVFPGPFDLTRASAVTLIDIPTLEELVDHHLVVKRGSSGDKLLFALTEPVKQFALDRLRERSLEAETRLRHASYIRDLAEALEYELIGAHSTTADQSVSLHLDDIFAALDWAFAQHDAELAVRIFTPLRFFLAYRVHWSISYNWLHRVLELTESDQRLETQLHARFLITATMIAYHAEHYDESVSHAHQSVSLARSCGHDQTLIEALGWNSQIVRLTGDLATADAWTEEAYDIAKRSDVPRNVGIAAAAAGAVALFQCDLERAERAFRDALAATRTVNYATGIANCLSFLGFIYAAQGDFDSSRIAFQEALSILQPIMDTHYYSVCAGMAHVELLEGNLVVAARWLAESLEGRWRRGDLIRVRRNMCDMGWLAVQDQQPHLAAQFWGSVDAKTIPTEPNPLIASAWRSAYLDAKDKLNAREFEAAYRRGQVQSLKQVTARAIEYARSLAARVETSKIPSPSFDQRILSTREAAVLRLVMNGLTDRQVGETLFISPQTATKHVKNIMAKLSVTSRSAAVAVAIRKGLLAAEDQ